MVDQPHPAVPHEQVRIPRGAVDVRRQRVEPDDIGGDGGVRREPGAGDVRERAREEVDAEVDADARDDQLLDLGVRLGRAERRVELDRDEFGDEQAERAGELTDDHLGDERPHPLAGAAELDDVQPVVVGLRESRQRAALPERGDVPGRGHRTERPARCRSGVHAD